METGFGRRVGGRVCLDFVNTVRAWVPAEPAGEAGAGVDRVVGERLDSYEALLRWSRFVDVPGAGDAGVLARSAAVRPDAAAAVVERAHALREAIYRLVKGSIEGRIPEPAVLAVLDGELRAARTREHLVVAGRRLSWAWDPDPDALDRMLWPVATCAGELLTSAELQRAGQCAGADCGWLFLDTSRSGRRRWCHMADCGNVAKVRRYRRRHDPVG